jgi:predicted ATPase/energy-coupling factor transporter ATP-binding protein EcfA2
MKLVKAQVKNYRSIIDSGPFDVERSKTILVGPNEAGKTALLRALQQINPPDDVPKFEALRDYPRAHYNEIATGRIDPAKTDVVIGYFILDEYDSASVPPDFRNSIYIFGRRLDNSWWHRLEGGSRPKAFAEIKNDLQRLSSHMDQNAAPATEDASTNKAPSAELASLASAWTDDSTIGGDVASCLNGWLTKHLSYVSEQDEKQVARFEMLQAACGIEQRRNAVLKTLHERLPVFVLFSDYFRVHPIIHLEHLSTRLEKGLLDDGQYDFGNQCLLKLLGFTPRDLSDLGKVSEPDASSKAAFKAYRDQLDKRAYQLNAASVRLTHEIRSVWNPTRQSAEADRLRISADGQYLKVAVEDDLGVEIELDQRSEGFQWLVSFFVVFFAEAGGKHKNAILLLDEPALSLHGVKQREFRETLSRLAMSNQTIYTAHSPFLIGPDELDLVRVVEVVDRRVGTKVHTFAAAEDPTALLPLQEALGYDLAQSLFAQQRSLVLEGLTDFWYLEATSELLRSAGLADLNDWIELIPCNSAGKLVYYATILHAHKLKVAALLESDSAGEQAAKQELLAHKLGHRGLIRIRDAYVGKVRTPQIEDLLRATLIRVAKEALGWDVSAEAASQPEQPIAEVFASQITGFSKYKLAKAYVQWTREHDASELEADERTQWFTLIGKINSALR